MPTSSGSKERKAAASAKLLPSTLMSKAPLSFSTCRVTLLTPAFWMVSAISREMVAPAETRISPVSGLTTSSDAMPPAMRAASASFLLNL